MPSWLSSGGSEWVYSCRTSRVAGTPLLSADPAGAAAFSRAVSSSMTVMDYLLCVSALGSDLRLQRRRRPFRRGDRAPAGGTRVSGSAGPVRGLLGGKDPT